jgi:hypothetical protein
MVGVESAKRARDPFFSSFEMKSAPKLNIPSHDVDSFVKITPQLWRPRLGSVIHLAIF